METLIGLAGERPTRGDNITEQAELKVMAPLTNTRLTILAIDDEAEILTQIATIVEGAGYACQCAVDAAAALEVAFQATPDLILIDLNLAGQSGLALCDRLRREPGLETVPVMFLSAGQVPDIIRRPHADGAAYYLRKPCDGPVLVELIEKALRVPPLVHA